jgi:hypothetical protein
MFALILLPVNPASEKKGRNGYFASKYQINSLNESLK